MSAFLPSPKGFCPEAGQTFPSEKKGLPADKHVNVIVSSLAVTFAFRFCCVPDLVGPFPTPSF